MDSLTKVVTSPEVTPGVVPPPMDIKVNPETEKPEIDSASRSSLSPTKENEETDAASVAAAESPDPSGNEPEYLTGAKLIAVIGSITLVAFLMLLDTSIVATAVPNITNEFRSLPDVGWYGSAYQLASAALQPLSGKIYSRFSIKWTFLFFFALFELGSLICGVANSSKVLVSSISFLRCPVATIFAVFPGLVNTRCRSSAAP